MEEDNEVLDWGNEEDENHRTFGTPSFAEDADDAVSLGDEDEDTPFYAQQENGNGSLASAKKGSESESASRLELTTSQDMDIDKPPLLHRVSRQDETQSVSATETNASSQNESPKRSQPLLQPRLTHALPPKPVAASLPYIPPSHHSIVEATAMAVRTRDFKRNSGSAEKNKDPLPPNWEIRYPRSGGRAIYYYNTVTHQSTWQHPGHSTPSGRTKSGSTSGKPPPVDAHVSQTLSYEDRHYRPDGSPDLRREDRMNDGLGGERVYTPPPRSPRSRDRPRSASPPPATPREMPSEMQDGSLSSHSNLDADLKGELPRDPDLLALDSTGHANNTIRHQQSVVASVAKPASPAVEDWLLLPRNHSVRGRSRERESSSNTVEGRQEANHNLGLASSRPRSPSQPRDREWIPGHREQPESGQAQNASTVPVKVESTPRATRVRDRPSRFDQPSAALQSPTAPIVVPLSLVERSTTPPLECNVHITDDVKALHTRLPDRNVGNDIMTSPSQETSIGSADNHSTPVGGGPDRWQVPPPDSGFILLASDQPGPSSRRKRVPLPPQSASFREEASRRRDHDSSREVVIRPASVPSSAELQGTPGYGSYHLGPLNRVEPDVERPRRRSASGSRYTGDGRRGRATSHERERNGTTRSYSRPRPNPSTDMPMDVDFDYLPPNSSRALPGLPSRVQDNKDDEVPRRAAKATSTRPPISAVITSTRSPTEASISYAAGETRRDAREDYMEPPPPRQSLPPKNQRAFHERPDTHVPPHQSRGRSDERRHGLSGPPPKLTGPNSVPIGSRRPMSSNSDANPRFAEDTSPPSYPLELPPRSLKLPPLPPSKVSHERPTYDVRPAADNYRPSHQDYASNGQRRRGMSPPPYDRDYQPESVNSSAKEARRDNYPQERPRPDHLVRENRVPQSDDRPAPHSRGRSRSAERPSTRVRVHPPWLPPKPVDALPPSSNLDFVSARNSENRDYRRGTQGQQRPQPENFRPYNSQPLVSLPEVSHKPTVENAVRTNKHEPQRHYQEDHRPPRRVSSQLPPARSSFIGERQELGQLNDVLAARPPNVMGSKETFSREFNRSQPLRKSDIPNPQKASPIDDGFTERPYARSSLIDSSYADQSVEQIQTRGGDRDSYSQARRHQSERPRHADPPPLRTPSPNEHRRNWGDPTQAPLGSGIPETHEDRKVWRSIHIDRYAPDHGDYDDGFPGKSQRQRRHPPPPPLAKEDSQRGEPSHRGDSPYAPLPFHDQESTRTGTRRLLDRLSLDEPQDRIRIPEKRDRDEVDRDYSVSAPQAVISGAGEPVQKRPRRRGNRIKRGRRGSGAP